MAFFHQLRLLLWKNYTLKKRQPFIFIAELTVPLILFLILVTIRDHKQPYKTAAGRWEPNALPSAGIVPLLQSFCNEPDIVGKNGYRIYPNASINIILKDFADVAETPIFSAVVELKNLESDFEDFQNDYPQDVRTIRDVKFRDLLKRNSSFEIFLSRNLSMPTNLKDNLLHATFNGSQISKLLLEKNEKLYDEYINSVFERKSISLEMLQMVQQSALLEAIFDDTSITDGPTWLRLMMAAAGLEGVTLSSIDYTKLEYSFKRLFLNASKISFMSCNKAIFDRLVILPNTNGSEINDLRTFLCRLNETETIQLAEELQDSFNWTSVTQRMKTRGQSIRRYEEKAEIIRNDLLKVENLKDAFIKLSILLKDMNLNLTRISHSTNHSRPSRLQENANELWRTLSPVICGKPYTEENHKKGSQGSSTVIPELLEGYRETTHALKVMLYMLTHDPMILYSPNGTDADVVVRKSGHFLDVMQETKRLAGKLLIVSKQFQEALRSEKTQANLKKLLKSVNDFPFIYDARVKAIFNHLNETEDSIQNFILKNNESFWLNTNLVRQGLRQTISYMITRNGQNEMMSTLNTIDYVARGWQVVLEPMKLDLFYGFPNETMLMKFIENRTADDQQQKPLLSAILFDNIKKDGSLPKHIHYRIRMDSRFFFSTQSVRSRYWYPGPLSGNAKYYYYGFVWIQDQLERAMIDILTGKNITNPGLYVQQMPYPCYLNDNFMLVIQYIMPLCVVVSFIYSVAILVQSIVYEKEQRLKEVMKMMGLNNAVHWTAWFITSICIMMAIVVLLTTVLKTGSILPASNTAIILLFLTLAAIATIMFCFLMSIFFSKAKLAAACGGIIYFVTYMPYVFISIQEGGANHMNISANFKILASLFSTTAFGLGARYFALFEQNGVGVQWDNIASSPIEDDEFNMGQVFFMLIVDTFIYAILVWYIEAIHPGTYGLPRPWYFPFQLSYWFGPHNSTTDYGSNCFKIYRRLRGNSKRQFSTTNTDALLAVEDEPRHLKLGVAIDNLVKTYKKGTPPAVDHLSLNLYEGQIMSFLGHNGAGKTTTMSLLTGLFSATSGTAYIYEDDIHTDMDKIRRSLGLCPQHNVLYSKLTVEEHLWFYSRLKGMTTKQVEIETTRILEDIGLPDKRENYVETLSGGMKRKLSVAMAFVGGSRTVILDEPTAGVDPYARRAIWELLAKYKDGRTILLSTHFMDEADILGDRIAIISHGKLRCVGSSLFLKTKFGDGYHLTLVKELNSKTTTDAITKFIQIYVKSALLICETQYELSFILPDKGKEKKNVLRNVFKNLEKSKHTLGIKSFGLQDTTLEEVFLKVTEAAVSNEEENELTASVEGQQEVQSPPIVESPERSDNITMLSPVGSITSSGSDDQSLSYSSTKVLISPERKFGHRRSHSTDTALLNTPKPHPAICAHRRTPSGTYCGHRRAASSDLTFSLTKSDINTPETVKKVSSHKRVPSGTSKINKNIGNESWDSHVGATSSVNSAMARWQQFYGLILKRFHHSKRNIKALINHILLPGIFVSIAMTVALSQPKINTYPPLVLSPTMYHLHPPPFYTPFNNNNRTNNMSRLMEESLWLPSGIGSDCVLKDENSTLSKDISVQYLRDNLNKYYDSFCSKRVGTSYGVHDPVNGEVRFNSSLTCFCTKQWQFQCDDHIGGSPETFSTVTQDTLQKIEEEFMTYLLNTNDLYRRKRYGALTFGDQQENVPENLRHSKYVEIQKLYAKETARIWTSNKGFHSMPAYLNAMDNTILRAAVTPEMGNPSAYGITAISHPLNLTRNVLNMDSIKQGTDTIIAIFVIIAMSFVPASFVVFLVMERTTKAKHIQFVSGVSPVLYWLSNYVWDFLNFMIPAMSCMFIFHAFAVPAYASKTNFPAVCALFICYGWSITPMMYPASFLFREASTGYVVLILLNLFLGITCTVTVSILQLFPNDSKLLLAFNVVKSVSLIFPNYCLGRGLMDLAYNELLNQVYIQTGQFDLIQSPLEWDVVLRSLVFMASEGVIFFVITLMIEYRSSIRRKAKILMERYSIGEDCDVAAERQRVLSGGADDDILRVENLTKVYNSAKTGKHLAVNRLCLGVAKGECFGLLGVNGAGKTTTFKMLTGDINATSGDAYVDNKSIVRDLLDVHRKIGYCPQFDALIDHLTAEEHLYLYARLKGIPESEIPGVVSWLIKKMALSRYAKKPSKTYSGGNKRKLSAAIALIGNPSVIFMDEPTTGMDPGARRFLWNIITSIIKEGTKSVVLTSHSMEECEALCTRLAIMVNGKFQCLGSTQHIKDRFGDGYIVVVRVKGSLPNMSPVKLFMEETFPDIILKECHHNMVQYQIPSSANRTLSEIFAIMEGASQQLVIEDYSVSQTSLDNVFVNFARDQRDMAVENDPSFVCSNTSKLDRIRARLKRFKENISGKKKPKTRFTQVMTEMTGDIGQDEDEVTLEDIDPFLFTEDSNQLTFDL